MASFRERNDRKARSPQNVKAGGERQNPQRSQRPSQGKVDPEGWLWGWHAVEAALSNPRREGPMRLLATPEKARELESRIPRERRDLRVEPVDAHELNRMLPQGAVHQGVALRAAPLEGVDLYELAEGRSGVIVMLDQVTDPQNVGAIFRSALAFGAKGIVLQDRHAPALSGALAKAATGATERLPCARVVNLSRALETLAELGWRAVGLDGSAELTLEEALDGGPTVLVMGSEGEGIRRLVAEHCDVLAKIPMPGGFESLNVSNATAVALYEASRKRG